MTEASAPASLIGRLYQHRFFRDKLSLAILVPSLVVNGLSIIILVVNLAPVDFDLPVRYSSLEGFNELGPWYSIYSIGLFGLIVTIVNTAFALLCFHRSRITSFVLMIGAFVVGLFTLMVSIGFAGIVR